MHIGSKKKQKQPFKDLSWFKASTQAKLKLINKTKLINNPSRISLAKTPMSVPQRYNSLNKPSFSFILVSRQPNKAIFIDTKRNPFYFFLNVIKHSPETAWAVEEPLWLPSKWAIRTRLYPRCKENKAQ